MLSCRYGAVKELESGSNQDKINSTYAVDYSLSPRKEIDDKPGENQVRICTYILYKQQICT